MTAPVEHTLRCNNAWREGPAERVCICMTAPVEPTGLCGKRVPTAIAWDECTRMPGHAGPCAHPPAPIEPMTAEREAEVRSINDRLMAGAAAEALDDCLATIDALRTKVSEARLEADGHRDARDRLQAERNSLLVRVAAQAEVIAAADAMRAASVVPDGYRRAYDAARAVLVTR